MSNVWRVHLRAEGENQAEFCLNNGIVGVGWQVEGGHDYMGWEEYCALGKVQYHEAGKKGWWLAVNAIHNGMNIGDLCWVRDTRPQYYLGRISGNWSYRCTHEHVQADTVNVRVCNWHRHPVRDDDIPGKVIACFRARRTVQRIGDKTAVMYSKYLWNEITGSVDYDLEGLDGMDFFQLLTDQDTEDLVFLYLQKQGWRVVPHSRQGDTMNFEFYLLKPPLDEAEAVQIAYVQVRTGNAALRHGNFNGYEGTVFVFQPNDQYDGVPGPNIRILQNKTLLDFVRHDNCLLGWLRAKWDMFRDFAGGA